MRPSLYGIGYTDLIAAYPAVIKEGVTVGAVTIGIRGVCQEI